MGSVVVVVGLWEWGGCSGGWGWFGLRLSGCGCGVGRPGRVFCVEGFCLLCWWLARWVLGLWGFVCKGAGVLGLSLEVGDV